MCRRHGARRPYCFEGSLELVHAGDDRLSIVRRDRHSGSRRGRSPHPIELGWIAHHSVVAKGVATRDIVLIALQLRVGRRDVVELIEGLHRDLPIALHDDRLEPTGAQFLEFIGRAALGYRIEEFAERFGLLIEIDEYPAPPGIDQHRLQRDIGVGHMTAVVPVVSLRDALDRAIQMPTPAVEAARDFLNLPFRIEDAPATMLTSIVKGFESMFGRADDDDCVIADVICQIAANVAQLLDAARHLPDFRPKPLLLEFRDLRRKIDILRQQELRALSACRRGNRCFECRHYFTSRTFRPAPIAGFVAGIAPPNLPVQITYFLMSGARSGTERDRGTGKPARSELTSR